MEESKAREYLTRFHWVYIQQDYLDLQNKNGKTTKLKQRNTGCGGEKGVFKIYIYETFSPGTLYRKDYRDLQNRNERNEKSKEKKMLVNTAKQKECI